MSSTSRQTGYYLNKTGERVNTLLDRQYVVPTLSTPPSDSTLSWDDDGYIVEFRIGDFCRAEVQNEYKFYRLQDVNNSKAVWAEENKVDLENYYTKEEVTTSISTAIQSIPKGVQILTIEEFEELQKNDSTETTQIYLVIKNEEPYELYIGDILIAKKSDIDLGFPYSFPFNF